MNIRFPNFLLQELLYPRVWILNLSSYSNIVSLVIDDLKELCYEIHQISNKGNRYPTE